MQEYPIDAKAVTYIHYIYIYRQYLKLPELAGRHFKLMTHISLP